MIKIKNQSKPISKLKKGDKIIIHGKEMKVDKQYLLEDHGKMKEMIVEVFNPKNDMEYQVRYFDDQVESSIEIYKLEGDFQYVRKEPESIEW
jgi:ASC-1-like (ASCH) protein|tara:strand:+ start:1632 stop:1907 length:276 start_codon:yes stop_codon:yes gene_type:complete